jgi:tRNA (guanine-N7-)-methyltransferase
MSKKKLQRFAENRTFRNMFFVPFEELAANGFPLKGKWSPDFFGNTNPICLELGCGKGEYTVGLAGLYPNTNFIGIDVKGARMWRGCKTSNDRQMGNVAFIRSQIGLIEYYFGPDEISEIWITFPDPQPKRINEKKRLTSPPFLRRYAQILNRGGVIRLKTDNTPLFEYTLETIANDGHHLINHTFDLYASDWQTHARDIQTHYENIFRAQDIPVKFLEFQLNPEWYAQ